LKKIFTFSATFLLAAILLSSCRKTDVIIANNEAYWLNQEEGEVVYSDPTCSYWVVETYHGYNIVYTNAGSMPYEGELIYGNFSSREGKDLYNFSGRFIFRAAVTDYWLSYSQALDAMDYYCPFYGKGVKTIRVLKQSTKIKKK
jgi:hypothetical protein